MTSLIKVSPSILAADFLNLGEDLDRVSNAEMIHVDVMDGHFVPNLSFGTPLVAAVKQRTRALVDVHMMVTNPDETVDWYIDSGADLISVHYEAARDLHGIIDHLHSRGVLAGVVINPDTPVSVLADVIDDVDLVLVMSVYPGFGGQHFIEETYGRLRELVALCDEHDAYPMIEVDGGVSLSNARELGACGANVLVAGSAVFNAHDPSMIVRELRDLATIGLNGRKG